MKKSYFMIAAYMLAFGFTAAVHAEVTGTVTLDGKAPKMNDINMAGVSACAAMHAAPLKEETVVVGPKNELANVVVSIKVEEGVLLPGNPPKTPAVLDQEGCQYVPHIVAMQLGQELHAKNGDAFFHNIHSFPVNNNAFNVAQPVAGTIKLKTPKEAEYIKVKCEAHPWMNAWVAVIDHPFFAVSDKDGKFTLPKGLPDGKYTLHVWHEKLGEQDVAISVKDDKCEPIPITVKIEEKAK